MKDSTIQEFSESKLFYLSASEVADDSVFPDGSQPTSWANAGFSDPLAFKIFLKKFMYWEKTDNRDSIIHAVSFPMDHPPVRNAAQFRDEFDKIFTSKVRQALQKQSLSRIFRNDQGAMIGNGEIWFRETPEHQFLVLAINN